jgi:hypothetical protein
MYDIKMLELAADLNVQLAVHAKALSRADCLGRIVRARALLIRGQMHAVDAKQVERIAMKVKEIESMERLFDRMGGEQR